MEKLMLEIKVYTSDKGLICIEQPTGYSEDQQIIISPEQIDTLIKWLQEAKEELLRANKNK